MHQIVFDRYAHYEEYDNYSVLDNITDVKIFKKGREYYQIVELPEGNARLVGHIKGEDFICFNWIISFEEGAVVIQGFDKQGNPDLYRML